MRNISANEKRRLAKGQKCDLCMGNEDLIRNVDLDNMIGNDQNSIFFTYTSFMAILMMAMLESLGVFASQIADA